MLDRKSTFKRPPAAFTSTVLSQDARRTQALEDQKRRRAQRYDSSRQLDVLADLSLGLSDEDEDGNRSSEIVRDGISNYAAMLPASTSSEPLTPPNPKRGKKRRKKKKVAVDEDGGNVQIKKSKCLWADKCMYAELLEMKPEAVWEQVDDGLPNDLEFGWIAVGGVPVGKRCLAVTYQSSGIAGLVPNTSLRSRLVGKHLLPPFPSILPPSSVLDCILDHDWQHNGILHILDVLKWKGQDIADCETSFRFWWRDTRLSELQRVNTTNSGHHPSLLQYNFPHPRTFIPVPYHLDMTFSNLLQNVIPQARSHRIVLIMPDPASTSNESMQIDLDTTVPVEIKSEGLLLYMSQATYEPGTSPLSNWIPISHENTKFLDLFESLVKKRAEHTSLVDTKEVEMDL